MSSPERVTALTGDQNLGISRNLVVVAIALISFASLLLELSLTRLFSVVLFYHFAFLAISIALLGLGTGGVFAYIRRRRLARWTLSQIGYYCCLLNSITVVVALEIILRLPVSLSLYRANLLRLTFMYLAAAAPFFLTGLLFSIAFSRANRQIAQLYGADLAGAALSCPAVVLLLNWLGGPNTVLMVSLLMAIAALLWTRSMRQKMVCGLVAGLLVVTLVANHSGKLVDVIYTKGLRRDVHFARWNAISRVEVTRIEGMAYILIDADARTPIMDVDPHAWRGPYWNRGFTAGSSTVLNGLRPHGDYAIIGPGGGIDVLRAVASGSKNVTAIEINPIIANTIMRGSYADYSHHLYEIPEVHVHVSDGRSWIRASRNQYDAIQMTLVDTWASTSAGAFALSENTLYTVEAFQEYFAHLKPDGIIAVTRWEFAQPREALRVVSQMMEALRRTGITGSAGHFAILSDGPLDQGGQLVTVLVKKSPFTSEEVELMRAHIAASPGLRAVYIDGHAAGIDSKDSEGVAAFAGLINSNDPTGFAAHYEFNITPVTDNAPFFFFTLKIREALRQAWYHSATGIDWKNNMGIAVLGMALVISLGAVFVFLVLPFALGVHRRGRNIVPLVYFVALGLGYIIVEVALIQRFILFLGNPTYALTVVVFLMLLSSGAGSVMSRKWLVDVRRVGWILAIVIAVLGLYVFLLPVLLTSLVGLPFTLRLFISTSLLVPLGFGMGMPFPTGLRAIARVYQNVAAGSTEPEQLSGSENTIEWAWAMNAAASVVGSTLAIVVAILFGLNMALVCAAGAYLLAMVCALSWVSQTAQY